MPFKPLLVIASLGPLPAAAFGDLDCITVQSCGNAGCQPETSPFSVTFDWANNAAEVTVDDAKYRLDQMSTDGAIGGVDTQLEYGDMAETNRLLRVEATGAEITAHYTFRTPLMTTWTAICDVRRAA